MKKKRLDVLLLDRGLVESREQGRRLIMAGEVQVDGQTVFKPSTAVAPDARLEIRSRPRFVSRGGEKLDTALARWRIDVQDKVCADVGASTGGFTDCLLQRGARRVYAIDVGKGILHWRLRRNPRIVIMEETNARHLPALPEQVHLVTIDAAFISLRLLLPVARGWLVPGLGEIVALVKPQFEAGAARVGKGGVVRDPAVHVDVLRAVAESAQRHGLLALDMMRSPLRGPAGNTEFLARFAPAGEAPQLDQLIVSTVYDAR